MKKGRKGLAMSMSFDELFKATLNMFSLDSKTAGDLLGDDWRDNSTSLQQAHNGGVVSGGSHDFGRP